MPKTKSKNFIIPLVVYPFDVMLSIAETDGQLKNRLYNLGISELDINLSMFESDTTKGRAIMFDTNQTLIRLRNYPNTSADYGVLHHEVFHCVSFIMEKVGMKFKIGVSDEAYSYLIQYLTTEIYKQI